MPVKVYFTELWAKRRYRGERFVYHAMRYCPAGARIKGKHRSTSALPLPSRSPCPRCSELAAEWLELVAGAYGTPGGAGRVEHAP